MKFFKARSALALTAILILSSGCASIVSDTEYPVTITSIPDDAALTIKNEKGIEIYNGKTPSIIILEASDGYFSKAHYTLEFQKDGYEKKTSTLVGNVDEWYTFGNIVFGGLIGYLIVDPANWCYV